MANETKREMEDRLAVDYAKRTAEESCEHEGTVLYYTEVGFRAGFDKGYDAGRSAREWRRVEDGLPETDGGYLITDTEGFMLVSYFQVSQQRFVVIQDEMAAEPVA